MILLWGCSLNLPFFTDKTYTYVEEGGNITYNKRMKKLAICMGVKIQISYQFGEIQKSGEVSKVIYYLCIL